MRSNIRGILWAYIKSMRVYLFFLSGMAGYAGVAYAGGTVAFDTMLILLVVFLGWGVNQVINDILGLKEDRINAPHRPLVTGELPLKAAIIISALLFVAGLTITVLINIHAIWLYLVVFALNMIYEYAKGIPLLGNLVFGLLMPITFVYGYMCAGGEFIDQSLLGVYLAFFLANFSLCFFTYYKDYEGDKNAKKKTLVVLLSPDKARYLNFIFSLLPFGALLFMPLEPNKLFIIFMGLTFLMFQYTAWAFFKAPLGNKTYYNLQWNYLAAVLYEVSFIVLVQPLLGVLLYVLSFVGVAGLFRLHKNHLS